MNRKEILEELSSIPEDEPVFILRASEVRSVQALAAYIYSVPHDKHPDRCDQAFVSRETFRDYNILAARLKIRGTP